MRMKWETVMCWKNVYEIHSEFLGIDHDNLTTENYD